VIGEIQSGFHERALQRFVFGGTVVSFFAALGDLKPKSFAGLLGAAPLATLSLAVLKDGKAYAQTEARSMIVGAIAFFI
jgi:hypothetical protein